jgi:hypothetical protein
MYWDSLTAAGAYVSIVLSISVIYLCRKQGLRASTRR